MSLTLKSYAKVNLGLDVLEKRQQDGYHYLKTIMLPVTLADQIAIEKSDRIELLCTPDVGGAPESNLALRAALLLQEYTGYRGGAVITVEKVIPVAGGLAGGSTNAAAVLKGLNQLWETGLTEAELIGLAIRLGSDVPFFIPQRPARVEGIGERVYPIQVAQSLWMVLATPDVAKSTGNVFQMFDQLTEVKRPDIAGLEQALAVGDLYRISACLGNVFEQVMLPRHREIGELREAMLEGGALGALMSGAGPTVLGIVASREDGLALQARLRTVAPRSFLVQTLTQGGC